MQSVTSEPSLASELEQPQRLRQAVLAGPGAAADIGEADTAGLLSLLADADAVVVGLRRAGFTDQRRRVLTGAATMLVVLGLCLFRREGYSLVLARAAAAAPATLVDGAPTAQALSPARARLGENPMRQLFAATAAADLPETPGAATFGLMLTAFDGTVIDMPASKENLEAFAVPAGGRWPQARLVTLTACGSRRQLAAALDSAQVSEQALVDQLQDALGPGMLNLADRNLCATRRSVTFPAQPGGIGGTFLDPMAYPGVER